MTSTAKIPFKKSTAKFRTQNLEWADFVMYGTFFVLQKYLTDVWKLSFTKAATAINIWVGLYRILPIFFLCLADTFVKHFTMLVLSGAFSTVGLGLVTWTTRKGYKCKKKGEVECVGRMDMSLFIIGMFLIAIGRAARFASAKPFILEETGYNQMTQQVSASTWSSLWWWLRSWSWSGLWSWLRSWSWSGLWSWITTHMGTKDIFLLVTRILVFNGIPLVAFFLFPLVKQWYFLFGISAACTVFATLIFLYNCKGYKKPAPLGDSLVTVILRVFVAAYNKRSEPSPTIGGSRLYVITGEEFEELSPSSCLGCLHKAAIKLDGETDNKGWRLCSVSEVESVKMIIRMLLVYTTFLIGGVVSSVGNTYVVNQALNMNSEIGHWEPPLQVIQLLFMVSKVLAEKVRISGPIDKIQVDAGLSTTLYSIICCTVLAAVERRRVHAVRRHDMVGQPDDVMVHMGAYWLLIPVLFLGFVQAYLRYELSVFHNKELPNSMKRYGDCLGEAVVGVGFLWGAFSVFAVSKISGIGNSRSWFRSTLNKSRLDRYYWVLSVLAALNLFWCLAVAYGYKTYSGRKAMKYTSVPNEEQFVRRERNKDGHVKGPSWVEILMS